MNDVATRTDNTPLFSGLHPANNQDVASRPVVFLRQISEEQWVVNDQLNLRGGMFRDLKSAQKFIHRDFTAGTTVVVQPRFEDTPNTSL